jgi:hypothetical protein
VSKFLSATDIQRTAALERAALAEAGWRIRGDKLKQKTQRLGALAARHGIKKTALYNWMQRVAQEPRERWGKVLVNAQAGGGQRTAIPVEIWTEFKALYLRLEQPTLAACYRSISATARRKNINIPTKQTFHNRLKEEVSAPVTTMSRKGEIAALAMLGSQQRDVSTLTSAEALNGDGYKHNVFVVDERGEIYRPHSWFWQCIRSRRIMSWRTAIAENKDTLRLSFLDVCKEWGIPRHLVLDNTRAAANKWLAGQLPGRKRFKSTDEELPGVWAQLGIKVHNTSINRAENGRARGHGQAKPIERAFRDFDEFDRQFSGAYTGRNTTKKPANYGAHTVPLAAFNEALKTYISEFNARVKRRTHTANGESYDQVFAQNYEADRLAKLSGADEMLMLLAAESRKVRPDATITIAAGAAAGCPKNIYSASFLYKHIGERLIVRFDPQDLHGPLQVFATNGRHLGAAECVHKIGFFDTDAARELQRFRRRHLSALREQMRAHRGERQVLRQLSIPRTKSSAKPNTKADTASKIIIAPRAAPPSDLGAQLAALHQSKKERRDNEQHTNH